jgi:hypothetical protein
MRELDARMAATWLNVMSPKSIGTDSRPVKHVNRWCVAICSNAGIRGLAG